MDRVQRIVNRLQGEIMADSEFEGLEGHDRDEQDEERQEGIGEDRSTCESSVSRGWPARPGQTQYEWEEPRVVVNSTGKRLEGSGGQSLQGANERLTITDRETSESGGTKEEDRGPSGEGVVAHSKCEGLEGQRDNKTKKHREDKGLQFRSEDGGNGNTRETQPELGGAAYGTSSGVDPIANRVDRLRLLGNGVVPQTCERALRVLMERLHAK